MGAAVAVLEARTVRGGRGATVAPAGQALHPPPPPICTGAAQGPRCLCWDLRAPSLPKLQTLGLSLRKNGDADFWHTARGVPLRLF